MFNDGDWNHQRTQRQHSRLDAVSRSVVVEVGAGTAVPTVRWFGAATGASLIRINLRESQIDSDKGVGLAGRALEVLKELERRWTGFNV